MGGYYVPKSQRQGAQPSGFEAFRQQFLQGYAIGQQRRQQQMQEQAFASEQQARQQQMEFHKLNLSKIKSELQLEEMLRPLKMAKQFEGLRAPMQQEEAFSLDRPVGGTGAFQSESRQVPGALPSIPYDLSAMGGPSGSVTPRSAQDLLMEMLAQKQAEARIRVGEKQAEDDIKRRPTTLDLSPFGGPSVQLPPEAVGPATSGTFSGLNQGRQQQFTAGENAKDRGQRASESAASRAASAAEAERDRAFRAAEGEKERGTKGLAGESAGRLAVSTTASNLAEGLKKDFAALKGNRGRLARVVAGLDPDINRRIDDLIDASSRIRTGATAPESEMKSKREQILRFVDLMSGDTGPAQESIQRILDEALQATSAIDPGGRHSRPGVTGSANVGSTAKNGDLVRDPQGRLHRIVNGKPVLVK